MTRRECTSLGTDAVWAVDSGEHLKNDLPSWMFDLHLFLHQCAMLRWCNKRHQMARWETWVCVCVRVRVQCCIPALCCTAGWASAVKVGPAKQPTYTQAHVELLFKARLYNNSHTWSCYMPGQRQRKSASLTVLHFHIILVQCWSLRSASKPVNQWVSHTSKLLTYESMATWARLQLKNIWPSMDQKASWERSHPACHTGGENQQNHDIK